MSSFRVGQKVVCVDNMTNDKARQIPELEQGKVYTIRKVGMDDLDGFAQPELCVWLNETYRDAYIPWFGSHYIVVSDFGFRPSRFRPVVERKTDISIFKAMLNPSKQKVEA